MAAMKVNLTKKHACTLLTLMLLEKSMHDYRIALRRLAISDKHVCLLLVHMHIIVAWPRQACMAMHGTGLFLRNTNTSFSDLWHLLLMLN